MRFDTLQASLDLIIIIYVTHPSQNCLMGMVYQYVDYPCGDAEERR